MTQETLSDSGECLSLSDTVPQAAVHGTLPSPCVAAFGSIAVLFGTLSSPSGNVDFSEIMYNQTASNDVSTFFKVTGLTKEILKVKYKKIIW